MSIAIFRLRSRSAIMVTLPASSSHLSVVVATVVASAVSVLVAAGAVVFCAAVVSALSPSLPQDASARTEKTKHRIRIRDTILFFIRFLLFD